MSFAVHRARVRDRLTLAYVREGVGYPLLLVHEPNPVPTLVLFGPDDHVVGADFMARSEVAFPERIGPLVVPGAGHFLQWEQAHVLNQIVAYCFRDLRGPSRK